MSVTRPVVFWIAMLAAVIAVVVLLRGVLLPFVAGMVLAYLFDPVATRLERLGMNRLIATLFIMGLFIVGVVVLIVLTAPIIVFDITEGGRHSAGRRLSNSRALAASPLLGRSPEARRAQARAGAADSLTATPTSLGFARPRWKGSGPSRDRAIGAAVLSAAAPLIEGVLRHAT
jgi:hypothetical protein